MSGLEQLQALGIHTVWAVDFEFIARPGERPEPVCLVARELRTNRLVRCWRDAMAAVPPFDCGERAVMLAFAATAELGCHLALDWPLPAHVICLSAEFRRVSNGREVPAGKNLLGALAYFGLDSISASEKKEMRDLILRGGPYTNEERGHILDYCQTDVDALGPLWEALQGFLDTERALLRGRYLRAVAAMEHRGVPIDRELHRELCLAWDEIQELLIDDIDGAYGVFEGRSFKQERFAAYLAKENIPWPRLPSGTLALDDGTFREMSRLYPRLASLRELRVSLSQMRLAKLAVGADGRNRCPLWAFSSKTSRNQPSNTAFIFGPSAWLRSLIRPEPGRAIAYVDWSQQEFGIAGALSGDDRMWEAYSSGDPYLQFAIQAGAAPPGATKRSHGSIREQFKACALAVQYGMGAESLALRLNTSPARARQLLRTHREVYPVFWTWSDAAVDYAMLTGSIQTVFGWTLWVEGESNPRSLRNFPMQANGAEMLRLACCLAEERGVEVCAPIHDALLVEGPSSEIGRVVESTKQAMSDASAVVLAGKRLRSDAEVVRAPGRYQDPRGSRMWNTVTALLAQRRSVHKQTTTVSPPDGCPVFS